MRRVIERRNHRRGLDWIGDAHPFCSPPVCTTGCGGCCGGHPPSAIHRLPSTVGHPPSAIHRRPSTVGHPPSAGQPRESDSVRFRPFPFAL
jgi:hypothetical protein